MNDSWLIQVELCSSKEGASLISHNHSAFSGSISCTFPLSLYTLLKSNIIHKLWFSNTYNFITSSSTFWKEMNISIINDQMIPVITIWYLWWFKWEIFPEVPCVLNTGSPVGDAVWGGYWTVRRFCLAEEGHSLGRF